MNSEETSRTAEDLTSGHDHTHNEPKQLHGQNTSSTEEAKPSKQRVSLYSVHKERGEELVGTVELVDDSLLQIRLPEKLVISFSREAALLRAEADPAYPGLQPNKVRLCAVDRAEKLKGLRKFLCDNKKVGVCNFEFQGTTCLCVLLPEKDEAKPNEMLGVMYAPYQADLREQLGKKRQREQSSEESEGSIKRKFDETRLKHSGNPGEDQDGSAHRGRSSDCGEGNGRMLGDSLHHNQDRAMGSVEYKKHLEQGSYDKYLGSVSVDLRRKIEGKKEFFFKNLKGQRDGRRLLSEIWMDEEASYSVTEMGLAEESTRSMLNIIGYTSPAKATITDGTSCVGGNVINFAYHFSHVNAIELDPRRMAFCRHNVEVLHGKNQKIVRFINGDALEVLKELEQDVLFFDPPWGGEKYDQNDKMDLFLSKQNMSEVCCDLKGRARFLVLKVPFNFNVDGFSHRCKDCWEMMKELKLGRGKDGRAKFHLLIYKNKQS